MNPACTFLSLFTRSWLQGIFSHGFQHYVTGGYIYYSGTFSSLYFTCFITLSLSIPHNPHSSPRSTWKRRENGENRNTHTHWNGNTFHINSPFPNKCVGLSQMPCTDLTSDPGMNSFVSVRRKKRHTGVQNKRLQTLEISYRGRNFCGTTYHPCSRPKSKWNPCHQQQLGLLKREGCSCCCHAMPALHCLPTSRLPRNPPEVKCRKWKFP